MNLFKKKQNIPDITSREFGYVPKIRILNIFSICIILLSIGTTMWFVYTNIYQTIGKVQTLLLMEQKPQFEPLDFKLYNETLEAWNKRNNAKVPEVSRNPFKEIEIVIATSTPEDINNSEENINIGL